MTGLAAAILKILTSGAQPPLLAESFPSILNAIGYSEGPVLVGAVETALSDLINAGLADREWRRGRAYYRAMHNEQVGYGSSRNR